MKEPATGYRLPAAGQKILFLLAAMACSHAAAGPEAARAAAAARADKQERSSSGVEVEDAIHGVRYRLPAGPDMWQVTREGDARSPSGVEAEVSSFPLAKPSAATQCRDQAHNRLFRRDASTPAADTPRDESTGDSPPSWSFTSGPASSPARNRWAFFSRGADCLVLHVTGPAGEAFGDETFKSAATTFEALALPPDRQREVDLLAGMGFLERRDPASALERFEALAKREPDLAKAHFGALMAGFELGAEAYARALPHGKFALKAERELTTEQRQLALRAVGVMQLAQNQVKEAAETLSELVVRAPDLAEGQYNYACALARLGDKQGAIDHLKAAVRLDGELVSHARDDEDLKSLRGSPAFEQLLSAGSPSR
ncbi:MAG: tetratricopeptide repeat protein [Myxococcales bacterium]|nr:hypothetical protein [Myxococcales bacterium]